MVKKKKIKSMMTFAGISKKYEGKRERARLSYLTPSQKKKEKPTLQERQEKLSKEERREKMALVEEKVGGIGRAAVRLLTSKGERTILKKPTAKLPSYDPKKVLMKGATGQSLVREGKTGYFSDEYEKEMKWLS